MLLGCSRGHQRRAAIAVAMAVEPQYVCGAAIFGVHQPTETKSEHAPERQHREQKKAEKKLREESSVS
jgi:hypothetical protein